MCQLTFCRFTSPNLTKMFATMSIICNTYIQHHDGWGIYAGGTVFKTEMNAQLTSDIGVCINDIFTKPTPIITHVRMASFGAKVCQENSHPFETKSFVLAHNGTLYIKKASEKHIDELKKGWKDNKDIIDSETFALVLEEEYKTEKDFIKVLNKTMSYFCGKFAFLIHCKPTDTYYIVKGKTADLHVTTFSKVGEKGLVGIVVNTESISLERTIHLFETTLQSSGINLEHSKIEELDDETIYKYQANRLIKVGEIKETEKETVPFYNRDYSGYSARNQFSQNTTIEDDTEIINKVLTYVQLYSLTIEDFDRILFFTVGKGILKMEMKDFEYFFKKISPKLEPAKQFRREVDAVLTKNKFKYIPVSFYEANALQFPWMILKTKDDKKEFVNSLDTYLKEVYD